MYTEREVPYTRIIEHKNFETFGQAVYDNPKTVISKEYSVEFKDGMERYYPVNDEKNTALYNQYMVLAEEEMNVFFGGRMAEYKYYDMAPTIERAMELAKIKIDVGIQPQNYKNSPYLLLYSILFLPLPNLCGMLKC